MSPSYHPRAPYQARVAALGAGAEAMGASPLHTAPAPSASVAEAWGGVCGHNATAAVCRLT